MINRDSVVLWLGIGVALVGYLITAALPPTQWSYMEWLQFASFVLGVVSAKLATSPLKGEDDKPRLVRRPRPPKAWVILPFLLILSNCASLPAPVDPTPTEAQVQATRDQSARLAVATKEALVLAVQARRVAESVYQGGGMSRETMQAINQAAIVTATTAQAFITTAETITREASLRATVGEVLRIFDGFIEALTAGRQDGAAIRAALAALVAYLGGQ